MVNIYLAGFIGTVIMTMMILFGDKMGLMPPKSEYRLIVDGLGGKMNEMVGIPKEMAWVVHFIIGSLIHPFILDTIDLGLGDYVSKIVYALIFGIIMVSMLGFLRAPFNWRPKMSMGIIAAHILYAVVLTLVVNL